MLSQPFFFAAAPERDPSDKGDDKCHTKGLVKSQRTDLWVYSRLLVGDLHLRLLSSPSGCSVCAHQELDPKPQLKQGEKEQKVGLEGRRERKTAVSPAVALPASTAARRAAHLRDCLSRGKHKRLAVAENIIQQHSTKK